MGVMVVTRTVSYRSQTFQETGRPKKETWSEKPHSRSQKIANSIVGGGVDDVDGDYYHEDGRRVNNKEHKKGKRNQHEW
jgi:hypothetical protein